MRPAAARTWNNFKTHFQNAQRLLRDQNASNQIRLLPQQPCTPSITSSNPTPVEYPEALINLASSATTDRELLTMLATSVAAINQHINQLNPSSTNPPPFLQTDTDTTTTTTPLSFVTTSLTELEQQLTALKKGNASLRDSRT